LRAGGRGKTCPPTIVGVGVGGTADLCVHLAKLAATRALGTHWRRSEAPGWRRSSPGGEHARRRSAGTRGDSTAFAVHVEPRHHITMNPVAVNMQCHSARRARATFRPRA